MVGPPGQLDPRFNYTRMVGPGVHSSCRINGSPCVLFAHARACLTRHNQQALEGDHWLSNRHISAVNTLLRQQHPGQNGPQDTLELSKNLKWRSNSVDFVQIVSPTVWLRETTPDIVEVFDSLPATFSSTLKRQVAAVLRCRGPQFTLCYIDVQQHQNEADDCMCPVCCCFCWGPVCRKRSTSADLCSAANEATPAILPWAGDSHKFSCSHDATKAASHKGEDVQKRSCVYCKCRLPWAELSGTWELGTVFRMQGMVPPILLGCPWTCFPGAHFGVVMWQLQVVSCAAPYGCVHA